MGQIFKIDGKWVNEWLGGTVAGLRNCLAHSKNYRFTIQEEKMCLITVLLFYLNQYKLLSVDQPHY